MTRLRAALAATVTATFAATVGATLAAVVAAAHAAIIAAAHAAVVVAAFAAIGVVSTAPAVAQAFETGFAQFGSDQSTPIEIEADALEVQDKSNVAVFYGNVTVHQAEAALQTSRLTVHYGASALPSAEEATAAATGGDAPATPQNQRISRLEANGNVVITSDGQSATGNAGTVDFDAKTLALSGNVTLSQGGNVVTGDTLTVDLNTGVARVESRGRVRVLLTPGGATTE